LDAVAHSKLLEALPDQKEALVMARRKKKNDAIRKLPSMVSWR